MRLVGLVNQVKINGMARLYQKKELQKLRSSCDCCYLAKWNKIKLANELSQAILHHVVIPCPQIMSLYVVKQNQECVRDTTRLPPLRL